MDNTFHNNPNLNPNQIQVLMVDDDQDQNNSQQGRDFVISPQIIPLSQQITGYQICKESFSQQQIIQAFKVIDINKDQIITEDDIMFFLEYIKQPYTKEQVKEMINMVSSDKKKVTFQDFKKIGKGSIIPFADIRIPDEKTILKHKIYQNIKNNPSLYAQDSSILINASKNDIISMKKFQESKKSTKQNQYQIVKTVNTDEQQFQTIIKGIQLYDEEQWEQRKRLFEMIGMVNIKQVVRNYHQICGNYGKNINNFGLMGQAENKNGWNGNQSRFNNSNQNNYQNTILTHLTHKQISLLLQITQKQAKILFPETSVLSKRVLLQTIAFSPLTKLSKLQFGISLMLKKKTIKFKQLYFLLQIFKGKDATQTMKKKLLTILKSKGINKSDQVDKFYILEIVTNQGFNFNF